MKMKLTDSVLIESDWNLKTTSGAPNKSPKWSINRIRLEFKVRMDYNTSALYS